MFKDMNKTVKTLLEIDGLLAATKITTLFLPRTLVGLVMPQYFIATLTLGLLASGYYQSKIILNKKKEDKEITENDLFKLED